LDRSRFAMEDVRQAHRGKQRVPIAHGGSVVALFEAKAGARGYQALINEALRRPIRGGQIEAALRRVTREEPGAASPLLRSLYRKDFHIMPQ